MSVEEDSGNFSLCQGWTLQSVPLHYETFTSVILTYSPFQSWHGQHPDFGQHGEQGQAHLLLRVGWANPKGGGQVLCNHGEQVEGIPETGQVGGEGHKARDDPVLRLACHPDAGLLGYQEHQQHSSSLDF